MNVSFLKLIYTSRLIKKRNDQEAMLFVEACREGYEAILRCLRRADSEITSEMGN